MFRCSVCHAGRRRKMWCAAVEREVDVVFLERGFPGFKQQVGVRSCTAFEPPSAVLCRRRCVDASYRRPWPSSVPLGS